MNKLIILLPIVLVSCMAKTSTVTIEDRVKKYMVDSVVPKFNDPSSYQYVSMKVDTFTGRDYYNNIKDSYKDTTLYTSETIAEKKAEIAKIENNNKYLDSVLHINIDVNHRGKNKFGALVLTKTELRLHPIENKIEVVD